VYIPKPNGKLRPLGVPAWPSRIYFGMWGNIFSLVAQFLELSDQYAYLPKRSIGSCWTKIQQELNRHKTLGKKTMLYEYDLQGFFDGLHHDLILEALRNQLMMPDELVDLFKVILRIPVMDKGELTPTTAGVPQGLAISPILSIITLNHSGFMAPISGCTRVQFSDDGLIIGTDETIVDIDKLLRERCQGGLAIAEAKSGKIDPAQETWKFLGVECSEKGILTRKPKSGIIDPIGHISDCIEWNKALAGRHQPRCTRP
jgi:hypothetical protein